MERIGPIVLALCLATAACSQRRNEDASAHPSFSDEGVGAQNRIGRYLQDSVEPKLTECWSELKGEGVLAADLTYRKSGGNWTFDNVKVTTSTLPEEQQAIGHRCLEASARGTTFAVDSKEALEEAAPQFVARVAFPVPLPAKGTPVTDDQIARMVGTGGGAGEITVPGCSDCVPRTEYPYGLKCEAKKSGSNVYCEEFSTNVCATTPKASHRGFFGVTRG